jgi:hypothetical protein
MATKRLICAGTAAELVRGGPFGWYRDCCCRYTRCRY